MQHASTLPAPINQGLRLLRVNQAREKGKQKKADAKADKKLHKKRKPKSVDGGTSSRSTPTGASPMRASSFAGGLFASRGSGSKGRSNHLAGGMLDWSRGTKSGAVDEFLDLSRRAGGLDASVRGGLGGAVARSVVGFVA